MIGSKMLLFLVFFPLIWGFLGFLIPFKKNDRLIQIWAFVGSLLTFCIAIAVCRQFDWKSTGFQLTEGYRWFSALGIGFKLGVDAIGLLLILMTTFLIPLVILSSFKVNLFLTF